MAGRTSYTNNTQSNIKNNRFSTSKQRRNADENKQLQNSSESGPKDVNKQTMSDASATYQARIPGEGASTRFKVGLLAGSAAVALFGEFTRKITSYK